MTRKNTPTSFGDIRSLLYERPVQVSTWNKLARALYFFEEPDALQEEVLPYCAEAISEWSRDLRRNAPNHWVFTDDGEERGALHPGLALATHVELHHPPSEGCAKRLLESWRFNLVESLEITHSQIPEAVFEMLLDAPVWKSLRAFRYNAQVSDTLLKKFFESAWCEQLVSLDLSETGFDDEMMAFVASRDHFERLEWLSLRGNDLTHESIEHLLTMKSLGQLVSLDLMDNAFEREDEEIFREASASLRQDVLEEAWEEYYWDVFE
jgi:hypothetical protein